ncbi:MAG: hypothetical protein KDA84_25645, partial [Planctomycetaceae bacterium]|nr:hypothetical protein [Planctomycetaceae bacterium]
FGYPAIASMINEPLRVEPPIPPGSYPVLASYIPQGERWATFVFVTVIVRETVDVEWQKAGSFFTDSGDGCIVDTSLESLVRDTRESDTQDNWRRIRDATCGDGDGRYLLSGIDFHAVLFRTMDSRYDCYLARDANGNVSKLLIDGGLF